MSDKQLYDHGLDIAPGALCTQGRKGTIRTFTGRYVDPLNVDPQVLSIVDIAHHLALINRYTGATPVPYSVGDHCLLAAEYFSDPRMALAMLLHDAPEAYLNDMATPLKNRPEMAVYRAADDAALKVVYDWVGVGDLIHEMKPFGRLKLVDELMYYREVDSFRGAFTGEHGAMIVPRDWRDVEREYIRMFEQLVMSIGVYDAPL